MIEIPLEPSTPTEFKINLNNNLFNLTFRFNSRWQKWLMTIQDDQKNLLLLNKALTNGVNIVNQYDLPTFLDNLYIINITKTETEATFDNIGETMLLISLEESDEIL